MFGKFFSPKAVAVVWASRKTKKLWYKILYNLKLNWFSWELYPINPNADSILWLPAYSDLKSCPHQIDLVIIAVPNNKVNGILIEWADRQISNYIIVSAGFWESWEHALEQGLISTIKQYSLNIIWPNCLWILNTSANFNASFAKQMPLKWRIWLISQSWAIITALISWANKEKVWFSKMISIWNKININENNLITYLDKDKETDVIMIYLESFASWKDLLKLCRQATKPIIILKPWQWETTRKAISSHTWALSWSTVATTTAFSQSWVIECKSIEDFFTYSKLFQFYKQIKGGNIAIITNAWWPWVTTCDAIEATNNLKIAPLLPQTRNRLISTLPSSASTINPIDIIWDALSDRYSLALEALSEDSWVNIIITILTPQIMTEIRKTAEIITTFKHKYPNKFYICSFIWWKDLEPAIRHLELNWIPNFCFLSCAIKWLSEIIRHKNHQINQIPTISKQTKLHTNDINKILASFGIQTPQMFIAQDSESALNYANQIGFPVALKISSPDILHKTDVWWVVLEIQNESQLISAFNSIISNIKTKLPNAKINWIVIEKMYHLWKELIIWMKRDPDFWPLIMFGLWWIYTEVLKDVTFKIAPLSQDDAMQMINELKSSALIHWTRWEQSLNLEVITETILKISNLSLAYPEIQELDLNPIIITWDNKALVLDAKAIY